MAEFVPRERGFWLPFIEHQKKDDITLFFFFFLVFSFSFLQEERPRLSLCHTFTLTRKVFILIIENNLYSVVPAAAITLSKPQRGTSISLTGAWEIPEESPDNDSHVQILCQGFPSSRQRWQLEFLKIAPMIPCPMVYTHLLPAIQSNVLLGVKGLCRCN